MGGRVTRNHSHPTCTLSSHLNFVEGTGQALLLTLVLLTLVLLLVWRAFEARAQLLVAQSPFPPSARPILLCPGAARSAIGSRTTASRRECPSATPARLRHVLVYLVAHQRHIMLAF